MKRRVFTTDRVVAIDEFAKDEVFLMAHVIFTQRQATNIIKEWIALQRKIKRKLLTRNIPLDPRLEGDKLPEIHAKWLTQSQEYYHWKGAPNKEYWKEHLKWLLEATQIIDRAELTVTGLVYYDFIKMINEEMSTLEYYTNPAKRNEIGSNLFDKQLSFLKNPYPKSLSLTLASLERIFHHLKLSYEVLCDDYDQCKGFSTLTIYNDMKKAGITTYGVRPEFLSSEEVQLIQIVDVCAYTWGQHIWLEARRKSNADFEPTYKVKRIILAYQKNIRLCVRRGDRLPKYRSGPVVAMANMIHLGLIKDYFKDAPAMREQIALEYAHNRLVVERSRYK